VLAMMKYFSSTVGVSLVPGSSTVSLSLLPGSSVVGVSLIPGSSVVVATLGISETFANHVFKNQQGGVYVDLNLFYCS
jgi:hypothetical protein